MTWSDRGLRAVLAGLSVTLAGLALAMASAAHPGAAGNLLVNGGTEEGEASPTGYDVVTEIPGWTRRGKFTVVPYGAPNGFPDDKIKVAVRGGAQFFAGGPTNPGSALSQTVSVASKKSLIDSGKAKATLSGYLGGYATQDDSLVATAVFLSQAGTRLGTMVKIGPVAAAARNSLTAMLKKTGTSVVPKQTRAIRVTISANRTSGSYNDGYADNMSLTLGR
jgi:hypothetical protein